MESTRTKALLSPLVLVFLCVSCATDHLPDQDLRIRNTPPAYKLPPDELWKEFNRDPKAAQEQYFGKAIEISGKVVAVQPCPPRGLGEGRPPGSGAR